MKLISYIAYPLVIFPLYAHTLTTTLRGTKGVHHQITRVLLSPSTAPNPRHPNPDPSGGTYNTKLTTPKPTFPPIPDQSEVKEADEDLDSEEPTSSPFCNESIRRHLKSSKEKWSKTEKTKKSKKSKSKSCKSIETSKSPKSSKVDTIKHTKAPKSPKALKATKAPKTTKTGKVNKG